MKEGTLMAQKALAQVNALLAQMQQKSERIKTIEAEISENKEAIQQIQKDWQRECQHVFYKLYDPLQSTVLNLETSRRECLCIICQARRYNINDYVGTFQLRKDKFPSIPSDRKEEVAKRKQEIKELEKLISALEREKQRCSSSFEKINEELWEIAIALNYHFNIPSVPSDRTIHDDSDDLYYKD